MLFVQPLAIGSRVCVAGAFNGWNGSSHEMRPNHGLGVFELCVPLPAGRHEYRLVIDGAWQPDPYNATRATNPFGESNSVIECVRGLSPAGRG